MIKRDLVVNRFSVKIIFANIFRGKLALKYPVYKNLMYKNARKGNISVHAVLILLTLQGLQACAFIEPRSPEAGLAANSLSQTEMPTEQTPHYWWRASVKMHREEGQETAWHMDTLLAHQIYKPLLLKYSNQIELWRFHRRAALDSAGHRFSFIFYAAPDIAAAIFQSLKQDTLLKELLENRLVDALKTDDIEANRQSAIEATSDKKWSMPMQRAWPYFAMGVSQLWLSLIDHHISAAAGDNATQDSNENQGMVQTPKLQSPAEYADLDQRLEFYRRIEQAIDDTWKYEGGHALLHHLNALFGYDDVIIYEQRTIRF